MQARQEGAQLCEEPDRKQLGQSRTVCGAAAQLSVKAATGSVHGGRSGHRPVALFPQTGHRPYFADSWSSQRRHFPTPLFGGRTRCGHRLTAGDGRHAKPHVCPHRKVHPFPSCNAGMQGYGLGGQKPNAEKGGKQRTGSSLRAPTAPGGRPGRAREPLPYLCHSTPRRFAQSSLTCLFAITK